MSEIWKDIKDFEGKYQVSNLGKVRNIQHGEKIPQLNKNGYYEVTMYDINGARKTKTIHRLVAESFILNSNNLPQVNHKDGNKTNNDVENLEWCSGSYNTQHAYDNKLTTKNIPIYCNEIYMKFNSIAEASRYFNCNPHQIYKILNGEYKQLYKKYTFKYA